MSKKSNSVFVPKSVNELETMCISRLEEYMLELEGCRSESSNPVPYEVEIMYVKKELDNKFKSRKTQDKLETEFLINKFDRKNLSMME